ncbi:hypothetical protein D9611_006871 [Ephemerocybe angulata]|uniref:Pre-rRNA-processing protein n=1 Tax=Ephemerocybe angulata TaxID=980116 RepID=A0A8H5EVJ1_9AGAR|nr:hypothetical protein D9611_006871 [Tulosesus angulatus]
MPKSVKKKRDKAADFTKAKLKLGKGKKAADNAIDTSFKARSIVLPTQSIVIEKDATTPLTRRNHSFNDLIILLKHYSAVSRKDAILGMRELLEAHWDMLESNLTVLINAVVRLIGDEDSSVRKTLLGFLSWLIPRIPTENLIPHAQLLILFTTSAQTHIFPEIRIDAIKVLDILLESIPQTVVSGINTKGHGSRVLDGYLGILNAGTKFGGNEGPMTATSTASVTLSPASRLVVFNSLSTFLKHALTPTSLEASSSQDQADPTKPMRAWFLKSAFQTQEAFLEFEQVLLPKHSAHGKGQIYQQWQEHVEYEGDDDEFISPFSLAKPSATGHWTLQDLTNVLENPTELGSSESSSGPERFFVGNIARTMHPSLVATFLDYAPNAFSPSGNPALTDVDLILAVSRIAHTLYKTVFQEVDKAAEVHIEELQSLLGYMTPYFPAQSQASKNIRFEQFYEEYNLIYCELTALLMITSKVESSRLAQKRKAREARGAGGPSTSSASAAASKRDAAQAILRKQAARISDFIMEKLRGQASSAASSGISSNISPAAYLTLLPTIWTLINNSVVLAQDDQRQHNEVLQVTLEHAVKVSSKAATKRLTVEFVSRLALLDTHTQYRGNFKLGSNSAEDERFKAWLLHLPQVLWELGSSNLLATETILRAILRVLQRRSRLLGEETLSQLQSRMAPYFTINHAVRGRLAGPFSKLPATPPAGSSGPTGYGNGVSVSVRRLALDVASTILVQPSSAAMASSSRGVKVSGADEGGSFSSAANETGRQALVEAVNRAVEGTEDDGYWRHAVSHSTGP